MKSIHCNIVLLICFIGFPAAVSVPTLYGDCWKYCDSEVAPTSLHTETICVNETINATNGNGTTQCSYCMFYSTSCPESIECNVLPPIATPDGKCLICPGQECIYNGVAYYVGDTFESYDTLTTCKCHADGRITCDPYELPTPDVFCSI